MMKKFKQYIGESTKPEPHSFFKLYSYERHTIFVYLYDIDGNLIGKEYDPPPRHPNVSPNTYHINGIVNLIKRDKILILGQDPQVYFPKEYQEWLINKFPEILSLIDNLDPKLKNKYSHIELADKFGILGDDD